MEPLDLTRQPPRSCYAELDGLMLMPRTIDKLRGFLPGGNPSDYFINGKTPGISQYLLDRLGISLEDLRRIVASAADEDEIAAWLRAHTDTSQYPAINETLRRIKPKHAHDPEYFAELYAHTLAAHPELERILDIVDEDDRRVFGEAS
jgi:Domain of unknown function (DUF5069)